MNPQKFRLGNGFLDMIQKHKEKLNKFDFIKI